MIQVKFHLQGQPYEYVEIELEAETWVDMDLHMDELSARLPNYFQGYDALDKAREGVFGDSQANAVKVTQAALPASIVSDEVTVPKGPETPSEAPPGAPEAFWDRPTPVGTAPSASAPVVSLL